MDIIIKLGRVMHNLILLPIKRLLIIIVLAIDCLSVGVDLAYPVAIVISIILAVIKYSTNIHLEFWVIFIPMIFVLPLRILRIIREMLFRICKNID